MLLKKGLSAFSTHFWLNPPMINHCFLPSCLLTSHLKGPEKCVSFPLFTAWLACDLHLHHKDVWEGLVANQFYLHLLEWGSTGGLSNLWGDHLIWNWGIYSMLIQFPVLNDNFQFFFSLIHSAQCYITMSIFFPLSIVL